VARHRFNNAQPYLESSLRTEITDQLHEWMSQLEQPFPFVDNLAAANRQDLVGPIGATVGLVSYIQLMFHSAIASLSSPSDGVLFNATEPDLAWIASPAYLVAQEHAIRATTLLRHLVTGSAGTVPQMMMPFFQYCVVRTGLVHLAFFRLATMASARGTIDQAVLTGAWENMRVHATALRNAQAALGVGEERTWWYEAWIQATGIE